MAHVKGDRVKETTTTTGTGTLALLGAVTGFKAFSAIAANTDTVYYAIVHQSAAEWEVGIGTWSTGNNLARTTIISSSNGDAVVNLSAGTKDVFCTIPGIFTTISRTVGITIDGGGSAITTGTKGYVEVPIEGTITEWKMVADVSGSCVMDVWVDSVPGTVPDNADSITASAKPTLTAQQIARSSTLTGWTTTVDQGDVFGFEVESASTVTRVTLVLVIETDIL